MSRVIDTAAEEAGRDPAAIRRAFNVSGAFSNASSGFLQGPPADWAEQLAGLALEQGMSVFILGTAPAAADDLRRFSGEVAPAVREIVGRERSRRAAGERPAPGVAAPAPAAPSDVGSEGQRALVAIHDHLRQELAQLRDVLAQVAAGRTSAVEARSYLARMTIRQNHWTLGAFCAAYCRVVSVHHAIEDEHLFPDLKAADQSLAPVLERLRHEHEGIAGLLEDVDAALVATIEDERGLDRTQDAVDRLSDVLLAHLRYEEDQLLEPIGRLSIRV
jgi:hemerythrin-like domain-containing protein